MIGVWLTRCQQHFTNLTSSNLDKSNAKPSSCQWKLTVDFISYFPVNSLLLRVFLCLKRFNWNQLDNIFLVSLIEGIILSHRITTWCGVIMGEMNLHLNLQVTQLLSQMRFGFKHWEWVYFRSCRCQLHICHITDVIPRRRTRSCSWISEINTILQKAQLYFT